MQNHAAVFREGDTLKKGCEVMTDIYSQLDDLKVKKLFVFFFFVFFFSFRWNF